MVMPLPGTYHPYTTLSVLGQERPFLRLLSKSLGSSSSPHTPSGRAARAISAKG